MRRGFARSGLAVLVIGILYSGCTAAKSGDCASSDGLCDPVSSFWFVNIPNYRIIFVSSTTTDGFFGGTSGADAICRSDAGTLGLSGTFKALIAAGNVSIRTATVSPDVGDGQVDWVLDANRTYVRTDIETTIGVTGANGLFTFPLQNAFSDSAGQHWTGMLINWTTGGTPSSNLCDFGGGSWVNFGGSFGTPGATNSTTTTALNGGGNINCTTVINLVCVQQTVF